MVLEKGKIHRGVLPPPKMEACPQDGTGMPDDPHGAPGLNRSATTDGIKNPVRALTPRALNSDTTATPRPIML
jgi:hypothetical protein